MIVRACVSLTVTVNEQLAELFAASLTLQLTVVYAIQDANRRLRRSQSEWPAYHLVRDRIVVLIETHIDCLVRSDCLDQISLESQQSRLS